MTANNYRQYTQARIALGHAGAGMPTKHWLLFAYHHACATDAINIPWDVDKTMSELASLGYQSQLLTTKAATRSLYLVRPDLGCQLDDNGAAILRKWGRAKENSILIAVSNGLSSVAVTRHLLPFMELLLTALARAGFFIAHDAVFLARNGRVGLVDAMGDLVHPAMGLMVVGERPGLSSIDSLAVYLTYLPRTGCTNADRNCVSNIRPPHGLSYEEAKDKVMFLVKESLRRKLSGVLLKEEANLLLK